MVLKYVIHHLALLWRGGHNNEDNLFELCYNKYLYFAKKSIRSVDYLQISPGNHCFPFERVCKIAIKTGIFFI